MPQFLYGTELNLALEEMITYADSYLLFVSPYIKLHERIKDELKKKKSNDNLAITILFGKNEDDPNKSISPDDTNFLKSFPNICICYKHNLHAKYYASEHFSLITSMNLHQFSQNTNIEIGVQMQPRSTLNRIANLVNEKADIGEDASDYFFELVEESQVLYKKTPKYQSGGILKLSQKYIGSNVEIDKTTEFFNIKNTANFSDAKKREFVPVTKRTEPQIGYCIRTGVEIPFNPLRPFCYEAYNTWAQFGNPDYSEKFCHRTGKPSHGKNSMRNPVIYDR